MNNPSEFKSQLKNQEIGINKMNVENWMSNREKFKKDGRGKDDLKDIRERIRADIATAYIEKNREQFRTLNLTPNQIDERAKKYARTILTRNHAILHNPDQVAGGESMIGELYKDGDITDETSLKASNLVGVGGVNSSIGSQWSHSRSENLYINTKNQCVKWKTDKKKEFKMYVELKHT